LCSKSFNPDSLVASCFWFDHTFESVLHRAYLMSDTSFFVQMLLRSAPSVLGGFCTLIIMIIGIKWKGKMALCMLPFVLHCLLWTSWSQLRHQWFFSDVEWMLENSFLFALYQWGETGCYWLCLLPAFIPVLLKGKTLNATSLPPEPRGFQPAPKA